MKVYRYPLRALVGDYLRAGSGVLVGGGVLLSVPPSPVIIAVFGGVFCLFAVFAARTVQRHITKVAVTEREICDASFRTRVIAWDDLERFKLRFYGTKRQREREREGGGGSFMQLTLAGGGTAVTYESSIEGFRTIAWHGAKALREKGGSMDSTSAGNLLALGLDADGERPPPSDDH